jgi:uncharacterized protein YyaL (SSP411 family)
MSHSFTNRLINETSPYLLQHAHNPVDWFAWGEEALQKAKNEHKVILVSIGYSACHWCHVMEKESFEKEEVALLMNEHFVNIKIDREERPDLDHIYMDAVQAISGSGGWPLNVFLTPEGKPFYGGTYYPPVKAFNRSSWTEVLQGILQAWKERKNEIEAQAENLTAHLNQSNSFTHAGINSIIAEPQNLFSIEQCHSMFENIMKSADKTWGGFGNAPKFPQTFTIQYLLQYQHFSNNASALQQALLSLDKMLQGGIYDHIGGGMARYSTDKEWLAPHFEKMLYDNVLLVDVLCDAWQITNEKKYKEAILKTIAFIKDELTQHEGGFYAALDADSDGVEGKYYVWQKKEIDKILGKDAPLFVDFFDVTEKGNWEETNILRILQPAEEFIATKKMDEKNFNEIIQSCLQKLSAERAKRIKPSLDDKIILSWNALALKAIAKAAIVLQDTSLQQIAESNFTFIESNFKKTTLSAELMHTCKNGEAKYPAFLDDYANLIAACIQLYELNYDAGYLEKAREYALHVIENFSDDENQFFFFTHKTQKDVILRKKEIYDGATPSGNSVMATSLAKLSIIFNIPEWEQRAAKMLSVILPSVVKYPGSFGIWASLLQQHVAGVNEIAVVGLNAIDLAKKISINYVPNKILMASTVENEEYPLLKGKTAILKPLIYCCKKYKCLKPVETIYDLMFYIKKSIK